MYLANFLLLAIMGSSLANLLKRVTSFDIQLLSTSLYSNNSLGVIEFTVQDTNNNLGDLCYLFWNPSSEVQPDIEFNKCVHNNFGFGIRYGLQIENFVLDLKQVNAGQTVYQVIDSGANSSIWTCLKGLEEGIKERCHYQGELSIGL
ncbi:hypothetical protein N7520_011210 [Penicillium odoratum]|uniref:uncharacterized protein n=1 Tax=Penicillium odoratum TaxID=1167516 RepID=UPI002549ADA7|nr:uncharacterized protein N7520_011210 [Penicillium odoratum]KAJ5746028.1 hypothetical protein N7520_011210 [Penicillium odoratum]